MARRLTKVHDMIHVNYVYVTHYIYSTTGACGI
jgi:hypothetical protein